MKKHLKRMLAIGAGSMMIVVGFALLFLPGPGIAIIAAGIFLISPVYGKKLWQKFLHWKHTSVDPHISRFRNK